MKKKSTSNDANDFPVSHSRKIKGTRRLAREKVLQILAAAASGDVETNEVFRHVFFREFSFDDKPTEEGSRILKPEEVVELEADTPIHWNEGDVLYATTVIRAAEVVRDEANKQIEDHSENWDMERIALLDRVLINVAYAELTHCADIPVKVTINETIELAKRYSTDKSGTFINGLLDVITNDLQQQGRIRKTGRGLVE